MEAEKAPHQQLSGSELNRLATSATVHCLTGCAIGEVSGMALGTALGWSNLTTTLAAIILAFFFGYLLTAMPLFRAGLALSAIVPIALGSDTVSIAIMEAVDNAFILAIPGAIDAGLGDFLFWGSIAGGFALAFGPAFAANRYLIARGRGHALVHEHHA
jgi:uncharacterized protein DUF4396